MAAITLLAAGAILAGCTGTSGVNTQDLTIATTSTAVSSAISPTGASSTPSPTPSPTSAPSNDSSTSPVTEGLSVQEVADRAAIEAQWVKFWEVYLALPHTPESERQTMAAAVAVDPGLTNLLTDANTVEQKGWDSYGQITHRITWPQPVDGKSTAVIADCQDTSQAGSVETSTGYKMTVGVARRPLQGTVIRGDDGVWRVEQAFYLKDEPC